MNLAQKYEQLGFGDGAIRESDWHHLHGYITENSVRSLLEIGAGYSSRLFDSLGLSITSYETDETLIEILRPQLSERITLVPYNYPNFPQDTTKYDMAFVDGPGRNNFDGRCASMIFASEHALVVFVHDSKRRKERESCTAVFSDENWREDYLGDGLSCFTMVKSESNHVSLK